MARMARIKADGGGGWYHVHSSVAGVSGEYVLADPVCQKKLIYLLKFYSRIYCCEIASFSIMGNHWHGILNFETRYEMTQDELYRHAREFYPSEQSKKMLEQWAQEKWDRFAKRIFDISEFMRNVQAAFATWYNKLHCRKGRFWADRYKSVCLGDLQAVQDCMLYVDLNPVRAGLVERPQQWKGSSIYYREINKADWLLSLKSICDLKTEKAALIDYLSRLYYRGNIPTAPGQAKIPDSVLQEEASRGFTVSGIYLKRIRYFADGLAIGSEAFIRERLSELRAKGYYKRRCHPISQPGGAHLSLREQRAHAVSI
jgi:REP element-mobilizing transposase RayT